MALEPYVRRRWPQSMITWSRVLGGGFRDPLVGGHLLARPGIDWAGVIDSGQMLALIGREVGALSLPSACFSSFGYSARSLI